MQDQLTLNGALTFWAIIVLFLFFQEIYKMGKQPTVSQTDSTSHCQPPIFTLLKGFIQGNCSWSSCFSCHDWLTLTQVVFLLLSFSSPDLPPHLEKIKQQANDAFARQQWTQAIQLYSLGIHRASSNAMLYGNRAAAYMKRKWCVPACAEMIFFPKLWNQLSSVCLHLWFSGMETIMMPSGTAWKLSL